MLAEHRFRFALNIIQGLGQDSHLQDAMSNDPDLEAGKPLKERPPIRQKDFSPQMDLLLDVRGILVAAATYLARQAGQKDPDFGDWSPPVSLAEMERREAERRRRRESQAAMSAALFPTQQNT